VSALHNRNSFAAGYYIRGVQPLALAGRRPAPAAAVVQCGFYPCGACTIHFGGGVFPLIRKLSESIVKAARGLLSCSRGEAPDPRIPLALRSRHPERYPRPRTVDCRSTTGRHGDDRGRVAHEASRAGDCASWPC
jgi:hypothetical protein